VKTRRNNLFGEPEEAIDFRKQRSLQQTINHYVKANHIRKEIRFDIIAVTGTPETKPDIRHIQNVALL
jgi:putative endonuclease